MTSIHGWNVSRQQTDVHADGLSLFRLGALGRIQMKHLRASELERIEVVPDESYKASARHSLRVHLKSGQQLELLTSVRLSDVRQACHLAKGLERLLRGEAAAPFEPERSARALGPPSPWRPRRLHVIERDEHFEAHWGFLLRFHVFADAERLSIRRTGRAPLEFDCDELLSLHTEPEPTTTSSSFQPFINPKRIGYRLIALLRRERCVHLLEGLPDPVFASYLAREASRRLRLR